MASGGCLAAITRLGQRCRLPLLALSTAARLSSDVTSTLASTSRLTAVSRCTTRPQLFYTHFTSSAAVASVSTSTADSLSQRLQTTASSSTPPVVVECACSSRPHPDKREGEDTYNVHASPSAVTLAVYDGVGSWSFEQGVDVSLFSKRIKQVTDEQLAASSTHILPAALLESVWSRLSADRVLGSCTACIVSLSPSSDGCHMNAVTLGDSGFLVLRKRRQGEEDTDATETVDDDNSQLSVITAYSTGMEQQEEEHSPSHSHSSASAQSAPLPYYVHYRSLQQLHYFNCPFQLGFIADSDVSPPPTSSSSSSSSSSSTAASTPFDLPSSALSASLSLRADDVVVLSSDGLFDNVNERQIVKVVADGLGAGRSVSDVSSSLASVAFDRSVDRRVDGPFAHAAKDHNIMWSGGRKDDITVIVVHISQWQH